MMIEGTEQPTTEVATDTPPEVRIEVTEGESAEPNTDEQAEPEPKPTKAKVAKAIEVDPDIINREKKIHQARLDFFVIDEAHNRTIQPAYVDEYARTVGKVGVEKPLLVKIFTDEDGVKRGMVFDGLHRILACRKVVANGGDPGWIPYTIDNNLNDEQRYIIQLRRNTGAPMTGLDEAHAFDQLIKKGWTREEIANESGKTISHIAQVLPIVSAPKKVQKYVKDDRISLTLLLDLYKKHNNDWDALTPVLESLIEIKLASDASGKKATKITDADVQKAGVEAAKKITKVHKRFDSIITNYKAIECETEQDKAVVKTQIKVAEVLQKGLDLMDTDPTKGMAFILKRLGLK